MNPKSIVALGVLTICAAIAAGMALSLEGGARRDARVGDPVFPDLGAHVNEVATIIVESGRGRLTLERGAGGWTLRESDSYTVMTVKADGSVLDLAALRFHEPKTNDPQKYARLNLLDIDADGSASNRVRVIGKDGAVFADVIVGDGKRSLPGTDTGGIYLRLPGEQQTWLAKGLLGFSIRRTDWLEAALLDIDGARIERVSIKRPDGGALAITKRTVKSLVFSVEGRPPGAELKLDEEPQLIASNLEALKLQDVRRKGAVTFAPDRTSRTVFETFDGLEIIIEITAKDDQPWALFAFAALPSGGEAARAQARKLTERTKGWVYRLAKFRAARFTKSLSDILKPVP